MIGQSGLKTHLVCLLFVAASSGTQGWVAHTSSTRTSLSGSLLQTPTLGTMIRLQASAGKDQDDQSDASEKDDCHPQRWRAQFAGVSVSPVGFCAVMQLEHDLYWPVPVTSNPMDCQAATSAEALTLLQLLSGLDLAGAILPPDVLAKVVVLSLEEKIKSEGGDVVPEPAREILKGIQEQLVNRNATSYTDAHPWLRARIRLPPCTLDQVEVRLMPNVADERNLVQWSFQVALPEDQSTLTLSNISPHAVEEVSYEYTGEVSKAFLSLSLALRYQAPVLVDISQADNQLPSVFLNSQQLHEQFPLFTTSDNIQKQSNRVKVNIETSMKIHQLQAAYGIARDRNDTAAMAKIRAKLDEMDKMNELPTQPESDTSSMQ